MPVQVADGDSLGRGRKRKYKQTWQIMQMWHMAHAHINAFIIRSVYTVIYSGKPDVGTFGASPPPDIVLLLSG